MPANYDQIPPERLNDYLQNAETAANHAAAPVAKALGDLVVKGAEQTLEEFDTQHVVTEAESITRRSLDDGKKLADDVENFTKGIDLKDHFMREMEGASNNLGTEAEIYANHGYNFVDFDGNVDYDRLEMVSRPNEPLRKAGYSVDVGSLSYLSPTEQSALDALDLPPAPNQ